MNVLRRRVVIMVLRERCVEDLDDRVDWDWRAGREAYSRSFTLNRRFSRIDDPEQEPAGLVWLVQLL